MFHPGFRGPVARTLQSHKGFRKNSIVAVLCMTIALIILASCGTTGQVHPASTPAPTHVPAIAPSPSPVLSPTPSPTPKPTPKPAVTAQPATQPPAPVPAILDVRPQSMSFVGHLDCKRSGTYMCLALVLSRSNASSNLHWTTFTNVPGHIVFSPASGTLAPGQSTLITISVPFNACTPGLFFFQGPVNTHTITWAC